MKRDWYNSTIFRGSIALMIVGAVTLGVAGRDDSARHALTAEGPAAPSDVVAPGRDVVVVIRPDNASDGAVPNSFENENIWQATLDRLAAHEETDTAIEPLVYLLCEETANEPIAEGETPLEPECVEIDLAEQEAGEEDPEALLYDDGATVVLPCEDALCIEFGYNVHELDTTDAEAGLFLRKPENLIIAH